MSTGHPVPPGAQTEWIGLSRSLRPGPPRRSRRAEFRAALRFRGLGLRVTLSILSMVVVGVAAAVITGVNGTHVGPVPPSAALGFPPATLAGGDFTAAASGRGISQVLGGVASDGAEIVAVGSQQGARIARAQFFVSADDGRSWAIGMVRAAGGGPPPPGHAARLVAGGPGGWVAIGPASVWTSSDGRTWTLASATGLPLRPGDQISVLTRTAAGFIAAGASVPGRNQAHASPVIFSSANGISWHRLGAGPLRLATGPASTSAGTGRVLAIRYAAADQNQILIAGDVSIPARARTARSAVTSAAWLSRNGGATWTLAVPPGAAPAGPGAQAQISGVAVTAAGLILTRPAIVAGRAAVDVYRSADGARWKFQATLSTPAGFAAGQVSGGPDGAVISGPAGHELVAFASADGASWRPAPVLGPATAQQLSGVTAAQDGTIVAVGATTTGPASRQPLLAVLTARAAHADYVDLAEIPGAAQPQLAVNAVAAGNGPHGLLVAVGGADGYPAAWVSADGGSTWARAAGQSPAVLTRPGIGQLTGVTYGADGWLAVGGVTAAAAAHPVVLASAIGRVWTAADDQAAFSPPGLVTEQAAAGPGVAYVIVGYQVTAGRTIAAAWWSTGLTGWHRAGDAPASAGGAGALDGPGGSRQLRAVTAGPHGFIAVGAVGAAAAAWASADGGRSWTQQHVPVPAGAVRAVLTHVASNGATVVAAGTAITAAGQQFPFAARSADGGAAWTDAALPVPADQASLTALTAAGGGFWATGTFGAAPGHQDVLVWTSPNGSAWTAATPAGPGLTGPGIQAVTALTASGGTLTGIGFSATPEAEQPVFWQSPLR